MRRQTPLTHLVYNYLYPSPTSSDPPTWAVHLNRNLVPEVRLEVQIFYGDLVSVEARYPGLNYCHPPHRMRLGRFKYHARLFAAFDALGLTYNEIQEFCCWEGTRWARERYEADEGVKVVDTTGDEIKPWVDPRDPGETDARHARRNSITRKTDISIVVEEAGGEPSTTGAGSRSRQPPVLDPHDEEADEDEAADADEPYAGVEPLSEGELARRREQAVQRAMDRQIVRAWERGQALPPEIEQYFKDLCERGSITPDTPLGRYLASRRPARYSPADAAAAAAATAVSSRARA